MNPNENERKDLALAKKAEKKLWRLVDIFIPGDVASVKEYVLKDVIGPTLRKLLYDIIVGGSYRMIFPTGQPQQSQGAATGKNYNSMSERSSINGGIQPSEIKMRQSSWYGKEMTIATRAKAESILNEMYETIKNYGWVTVAEYYSANGITVDDTANNYGWDDLGGADIISVGNGYQIRLPKYKVRQR